jgi:hypothetical protein
MFQLSVKPTKRGKLSTFSGNVFNCSTDNEKVRNGSFNALGAQIKLDVTSFKKKKKVKGEKLMFCSSVY